MTTAGSKSHAGHTLAGGVVMVALLAVLVAWQSAWGGLEPFAGFTAYRQFDSIYEPSGVQQLPDGRVIVVEDEMFESISAITLQQDGDLEAKVLRRGAVLDWIIGKPVLGKLEDLEGVDVDAHGNVYAITSHSRLLNGRIVRAREKLVRFRVAEDRIVEPWVIADLKGRIIAKHAALKEAASVLAVGDKGGFNIEGLSFDARNEKLLIGMRSPLVKDKALIVTLENPSNAFELGEAPHISDQLIYLDLDKGGIRALAYDPRLKGYLIVSRHAEKPKNSFKLWLWDGAVEHPPRRVRIDGIDDLGRTEGIAPLRLNGQERLLLVSDDGSTAMRRGGHYLLLSYEQLVIDGSGAGQSGSD